MRRVVVRSLLALGAALALAAPAAAVVGGRPYDGALARTAVMVLGSKGSVCSAVVLAPDVVLTAAHCVTGAAEFRVHFRGDGGEPVLIAPATIAVHPGYDPEAVKTRKRSIDLALVRLPQPLPARFAAATLSATAAPPPKGATVTLGGYGVASEGDGRTSGTFRTASLAVVEPYGPGKILLWAADPATLGKAAGAGACQGDSGGPLVGPDGAVAAVSSWSTGAGKSRCGLLTQGVLVGPQRAFIDRALGAWGRSARWAE